MLLWRKLVIACHKTLIGIRKKSLSMNALSINIFITFKMLNKLLTKLGLIEIHISLFDLTLISEGNKTN